MTKRAKTRLERLAVIAKSIITDMECVLSNIEDITEIDDLFMIESAFERAAKDADDAYALTSTIWDLFKEE